MKPATHPTATSQGLAHPSPGNRAALAGFTMVEIALSLGIIAFALVAIIGVLPSGIKVQQENREETAVNQDGTFLLEAIRSGAHGLDDLTNYVESITVVTGPAASASAAGNFGGGSFSASASTGLGAPITYTNGAPQGSMRPLLSGQQIVGLLSTPRQESVGGDVRLSFVTARMKSMGGLISRRGRSQSDFAFRYLVQADVVPFANTAPPSLGGGTNFQSVGQAEGLLRNLYDVSVTFSWPVFQQNGKWKTGNNRRTFRTLVSSQLRRTNVVESLSPLYFFEPHSFISAAAF